MTNLIKNICVYSSSSGSLEEIYYKDAEELGKLIGESGFNLVYGGSILGTMGVNAKAVKESGGKVTAVIPEKLHQIAIQNEDCDELYVTKGMRDRKGMIDELSDAAIALSGGFGTLEELSEMIVQKQLGYNDKAIVILNTNGFYDDLLKFFDKLVIQKFAASDARELCFVAKTPKEAIDYIKGYEPKHFDIYAKLNLKENV